MNESSAGTPLSASGVIKEEVVPEFRTYVSKEKVKVYEPAEVMVGAGLPDTYELAPVPEIIVKRSPRLKGYRYVTIGKRIAIVEPSSRKIVELHRLIVPMILEAARLAASNYVGNRGTVDGRGHSRPLS